MLQYQIEVTVGKSLLRATGNGEWPVTRARRGAELQPSYSRGPRLRRHSWLTATTVPTQS